jgi:hypothetical protein
LVKTFMETKIDSISQFLTLGKFQYRIYDLGRKLTLLPNSLFRQIENQNLLYPYPFQQKAWLALLFWSEIEKAKATIWFLQFPVDELGYLKQASRDAFMQELLIHVGGNLQAQQSGQKMQDSLKESAFAFKPRQDRLAIFHAFATVELAQPPSKYYSHTQEYLQGKLGYEQWEFLGLQGIADIIARLHMGDNEQLLSQALPHLPLTPLINFAENLEHTALGSQLTAGINQRLQQEILAKQSNSQLIAALIRALSNSQDSSNRQHIIQQLLTSHAAQEIEVIAAIASRAWQDITQENCLPLFMQALAHQPQASFNAILIDIMGIPNQREPILHVLRDPKRSALVAKRIGGFFAALS